MRMRRWGMNAGKQSDEGLINTWKAKASVSFTEGKPATVAFSL